MKDSFLETGHVGGEGTAVVMSDELDQKLNAIYGSDVAGYQEAILAIRTLTTVTGAAGLAKTGGNLADKTAKAVAKKLDDIKLAKEAATKEAQVLASGAKEVTGVKGFEDLIDLKAGKVDLKGASEISGEVASANAQSALRAEISGLSSAQKEAVITKTLPDGRILYYNKEVLARSKGATRGASFVAEYNPSNGSIRQWMESYDHLGNINRIHPKSINGDPVSAQHYPPTGAELKSWK